MAPSTTNQQHRTGKRTFSLAGIVALAASLALVVPGIAQATPTTDDIDRAKAEEAAARMSVAQIEVELASVTAQAQQATQAAQIAAEELNASRIKLDEATATATTAKAESDKANADYDKGRAELASIAQTAYRTGGSELDTMAPYLEADGLRTVETKQATIGTFGAAADAKMQRVAALEQVARIMKNAADSALNAQEEATQEVQTRTEQAQSAAESAQALQVNTEVSRSILIEELARKQNTTVALINERQAALEAQRQEAARQAAIAAAAEAQRQAEAAAAAAEEEAANSGGGGGGGGGYVPPPVVDNPGSGSGSGSASGAIAFAMARLGAPYVWGGSGPGYDCSGLTSSAYRSQGIFLTHQSSVQYGQGWRVPVGSAIPGDLVFWSSNGSQSGIYHVAIYLGNNQIVEAPTFGVPVRVTSIYNWGSVMPYAVRVA